MSKHKNHILVFPNHLRLIVTILFSLMGLLASIYSVLSVSLIITGRAQITMTSMITLILNIALISCFIVPYRIIRHCGRDTENRYFISAIECRKAALLSIILSFITVFRPLTPVVGRVGAVMMIIWCFCWYLSCDNIKPYTLERYVKNSRVAINVVFGFGCFSYFMIALASATNFTRLPPTLSSSIMMGVSAIIDIFIPYYISRKVLKGINELQILKNT